MNSYKYSNDINQLLDTSFGISDVDIEKDIKEDKDSSSIINNEMDASGNKYSGFFELNNLEDVVDKLYTDNKINGSFSSTTNSKTINTYTEEDEEDEETVKDSSYYIDKIGASVDKAGSVITEGIADIVKSFEESKVGDLGPINGILSAFSNSIQYYKDGVSETRFGSTIEDSWAGPSNSFLNYFSKNTKVNILDSTPLDSGETMKSVYGSMVLGCPFLFNERSDPSNRTITNTIVADSKILSLTPGLPKYNGLTSWVKWTKFKSNILSSPESSLKYILNNGINKNFSEKDTRYYTFETEYSSYFAYLETMLNAIWIKLGLAKNGEKFNIYSFFNIKNGNKIDPTNVNTLKPQYNSSIGFFTNIAGAISESVDSQTTGVGAELAGRANDNSSDYQRINYITGMGASGKQAKRAVGIASTFVTQMKDLLSDTFTNTIGAISNFDKTKALASALKITAGIAKDVVKFNNTEDFGAIFQSFSTSNGMKVVYPELWADSSYSKNINFNFSFVSPYGDPLSIFKYVYVPFCALACFALPRQADENGYVSPFFVRADVPGLFTSDLALISSFTWTKGGGSSLWTKDGLPRVIDCNITITDLYPYLSMTKRLSALSANPSYTVFLDSMAGMQSLVDVNDTYGLNSYFKAVINRVNGQEPGYEWNKFNKTRQTEIARVSNKTKSDPFGNLNNHSITWMSKI